MGQDVFGCDNACLCPMCNCKKTNWCVGYFYVCIRHFICKSIVRFNCKWIEDGHPSFYITRAIIRWTYCTFLWYIIRYMRLFMVTERKILKVRNIFWWNNSRNYLYCICFFLNTTGQRLPFCLWQCKEEYIEM